MKPVAGKYLSCVVKGRGCDLSWDSFMHRNYSRRVVVTGIGIISPLGCGTSRVWKRLLAGESGVTKIKGEGYDRIPCKVAAYVPRGEGPGEFNEALYKDRSKSYMAAFALAAADEALADAGWKPESEEEKCNTGVCIGVGMSELDYICNTGMNLINKGPRGVSPHFIPSILVNSAAGEVSIKHKFRGPNHCASTACATGAHAIGDAARLIAHGDCDVMVAGGSEASISPLGIAGFTRIRALSTKCNDEPQKASRPFHPLRDGFVMGEGAAVLVLEEENHARIRGANIYAQIAGYGLAGDANGIVSPSADGAGSKRTMQKAMLDANVEPSNVTYINAHATSTPQGDLAEARAITSLFENTDGLAVSSSKGSVGHLLGAAGAIEAAFTVLACYHSILPPTANLDELDPRIHLNCVPIRSQSWITPGNRRIALCNSFGFGGTNASLCVKSV